MKKYLSPKKLIGSFFLILLTSFNMFYLAETVGEISTVDTGEELDSEFLSDVNSLLYQTKNL